ncbi:MAG: hypothetical protein I8H86_06245 [Sphingomonadaceae bacterium]|nr:hypothetical protein [Sphingomonadaceae bacterium]
MNIPSALHAIGIGLITMSGIASVGLIASMLAEYRAKITAALLFEPIQQEGRHASGR